eukprot:scaffold20184_cov15-Tisochrysis_lutea.AAC.1
MRLELVASQGTFPCTAHGQFRSAVVFLLYLAGRRNPALKTLSRGSEDALTSSTERKSCVSINQSKALRGK